MKGRGITRTFEDLSLRGNVPQAGDDEASMASISEANFRPRSPLKSPPKMTARASSKPYDVPLPTAIGPGGLVSMLQKLRRIRDVERETIKKQIVDTTMETGDSEKGRTSFEDTFITCRGGDGKDDNANFWLVLKPVIRMIPEHISVEILKFEFNLGSNWKMRCCSSDTLSS